MQEFRNTETYLAICLEEKRQTLAEERKFDELLSTYRVGRPEIVNRNTGRMWDKLNTEFSFDTRNFPMAWDRIKKVAHLVLQMSENERINVLNVGFGSGNLESLIGDHHSNLIWKGLDISRESVTTAKTKYSWGKFSIGNIIDYPLSKNVFDLVIALEVLEHVSPSNTLKTIIKIKNSLKKKGIFVISVPINEGLSRMLKHGQNPNAHVRIYSPQLIRFEINVSGFTITNEIYLYAYHNLYEFKSLISKIFHIGSPNNLILICRKNE